MANAANDLLASSGYKIQFAVDQSIISMFSLNTEFQDHFQHFGMVIYYFVCFVIFRTLSGASVEVVWVCGLLEKTLAFYLRI